MAVDKINPFQMNPYVTTKVQPIQGPAFGASPETKPANSRNVGGIDAAFRKSVETFSQRDPSAYIMPTFVNKSDSATGLSPLPLGPLGGNALNIPGGKAGGRYNSFM